MTHNYDNISEKMQLDDKEYERLFLLTKKLLSISHSNEVLQEFVHALSDFYPQSHMLLFLTHEDNQYKSLPIAYFEQNIKVENELAFRAYQTGMIQIEEKAKESTLYIPFKGLQAMYGVLQLTFQSSEVITDTDYEILEHLADVSGSAFEKARLQEQLNQRINDLNLLNETSHTLNSNLRLTDTVEYMAKQIETSLRAEQVGFFYYNRYGEIETLEGSSDYFLDKRSAMLVSEISKKVKQRKEAFMITDMKSEKINTVYLSLLAVPMIHDQELKGAAIVLHSEPYFFTFENFRLLKSLIYHFTLAFVNSMLHEEMEKLAITDHLTRLYSRNYLDEKINESMKRDRSGTFILLDIDDFKQVNDTYGHLTGDDVIIQVANILLANKRETDIAARWGGEELALYLPSVDLTEGVKVAERLVRTVKQSTSPPVTISGGVSYWSARTPDDTVTKLFNRADQALYEAKRSGKSRIVIHSTHLNDNLQQSD